MANGQRVASSHAASIARERDAWLAAMNGDSLEGIVKPLASDSWAFPPNQPALQGVEAQRSWHQVRIAECTTRMTMSSEELLGSGDYVIDRLSYTIALTPRTGGPALQDSGCCFWIWQRDSGGDWKVARAIWNSANPIAAAV
jgi:ketosteroid isomerase-like protein